MSKSVEKRTEVQKKAKLDKLCKKQAIRIDELMEIMNKADGEIGVLQSSVLEARHMVNEVVALAEEIDFPLPTGAKDIIAKLTMLEEDTKIFPNKTLH